MNASPERTWADRIRAVHEEAAGVLTMLVIRQSEAVDLMAEAIQGDVEAGRLITLIAQTSKRIDVVRRTKKPDVVRVLSAPVARQQVRVRRCRSGRR